MLARLSLAHWFLLSGVAVGLFGLILWFTLPIKLGLPPFLTSALLAVVYGLFCLKWNPQPGRGRR